ncbi:MAG TPA: serine/threonine-protein kinase, partial [Gemmataceae bacterium]|nr:serine/threonine-protein kinase [Gemmataceae bacterium]
MADARLDALLDEYQDQLDDGRIPSVADLCRDCPDLRPEFERRVARLHRVGRLLGDPTPPVMPPGANAPGSPPEEPAPLSLSDDQTWVGETGRYGPPVEIPAPPGYQVIAPLDEGGMGIVYKARQVGLNRLVALKMILGGARARHIDLARFRDEAQAIASLRHPHIVQVYEIGEFRDQPFFSLEFCAGGTLASALDGEPQPARTAAGITEVLARAVHYAHTRGIIHRDLKPSNVLLSAEPVSPSSERSTLQAEPADAVTRAAALQPPYAALKITDFGLAKRLDDDSGRTQDGSVVGTPAYMAPEQAFGASKDVSPATDVHALGAILYELLTGRPPFKGSSVHETLELVRHRDPVRVRDLQPRVQVDVETICLKCLQKDSKRRYASAGALADDLRRFLDDKPIVARPVGRMRRVWRWARREPRTAGLVAATLLLAIALPAVLVGYGMRLSDAETRLDQERQVADAARKAERAAREAEETHRYFAALSEAQRLRSEGRPGWTWAALALLNEAARSDATDRDPEVLRTELAAAHGAIDLRPVGAIAEGLQTAAVAFAGDGRIAVAPQFVPPLAEVRYVLVRDPRTGTEQKLSFPGGFGIGATTALAFSPDGRWLVLALRGGDVFRWDLATTPEPARTRWTAHPDGMTSVAFTPDSKWLFTGGRDGRVKRWPVAGPAKEDRTWSAPGAPKQKVSDLAYWDGPRAGLLVHAPDRCRLLDPDTLTELGPTKVGGADWVAPAVDGSYGRFAVHPPTGTIAVAHGGELEVTYWERGICQPVATLRDPVLEDRSAHSGHIDDLAFHPSGILLATVSPAGGLVKLWHVGTGELAVAVPVANARAVAFSPDGRTLAVSGDHTTILFEVGGLSVRTPLARRGFPIRAVGLTADGKVGTVAVHKHPDRPDQGGTVASLWDEDGGLLGTVVHRASGPLNGGQFRVAGSRGGEWTAFCTGGSAVVWRTGTEVKPPVEGPKGVSIRDLAIDPAGQSWVIEGNKDLGVRPAGTGGKAKPISVGWIWNGRQGLMCVRAGGSHILVGCENGFLRVLRPDGTVARSLACFDETPDMLLKESANTVHTAALSADNTLAAAGTEDGRLWLFRLPGEKLGGWPAHEDRVTAVAFDPTGEWLASGGRDR